MPSVLAVALALTLGEGAAAPTQVKLAAPGLQCVAVPKDRCDFFSDHYAQQLAQRGIRVITAKEVSGILGLARSQQLTGCDEAASNCMAELADALGVDGVVTGRVAQFGTSYEANVSIVANGNARMLNSFSVRADAEKVLLDGFVDAARNGASEIADKLKKPVRHYGTNFVTVDALTLPMRGTIRVKYERPTGQHWSIVGDLMLSPFLPFEIPAIGFAEPPHQLTISELDVGARLRHYFFDLAPYGLYAGFGLAIVSLHGGYSEPFRTAGIGGTGGVVTAELGFQWALFDWLAFDLTAMGYAGAIHAVGFKGDSGEALSGEDILPAVGFVPGIGLGAAF